MLLVLVKGRRGDKINGPYSIMEREIETQNKAAYLVVSLLFTRVRGFCSEFIFLELGACTTPRLSVHIMIYIETKRQSFLCRAKILA